MTRAVAPDTLRLSILLTLQRDLRTAETKAAIGYQIVNASHDLAAFDQAVFLLGAGTDKPKVKALSFAQAVERGSPAVAALESWAKTAMPGPFKFADLHEDLADFGSFIAASQSQEFGLVLLRSRPFEPSETVLLQDYVDAACHAYAALDRSVLRKKARTDRRPIRLAAAIALITSVALLAIPVQQTTRGAGQIIARDAMTVRAPYGGVVDAVVVEPGQSVAQGDILARLDPTDIDAKLVLARKAVSVARAQWDVAMQAGLTDAQARADLATLRGRIKTHQEDVQYLARLKDRLVVRAGQSGTVLLNDTSEWAGRPVQLGERLFQIATSDAPKLRVELPVHNAIGLAQDAEVRFNSPRRSGPALRGTLTRIASEPVLTEDGTLAYMIDVALPENAANTAIGMRGTAVLEGARVSLFERLFRRPLTTLRRWAL